MLSKLINIPQEKLEPAKWLETRFYSMALPKDFDVYFKEGFVYDYIIVRWPLAKLTINVFTHTGILHTREQWYKLNLDCIDDWKFIQEKLYILI